MSKCIGVIAEDTSDYEVIKVLATKISKRRGIEFRPSIAHGCGRMRAKCLEWAEDLFRRGCRLLIIVQDCDKHKPTDLCASFNVALTSARIPLKVVVVPIVEMEAWLLADERAIQDAFGFSTKPKHVDNPEALADPKRYLEELVNKYSGGKVYYLSTSHNQIIATKITVKYLRRCKSFLPLEEFIQRNINGHA